MEPDPQISGIGQISCSVVNIQTAIAWYRDVLGLELLYEFESLAFFDCGGVRLMLAQADEPPSTESIVYLRVDNILAMYERLKDRGADFITAPHMVHRHEDGAEEWMAFFNDPDARPLAIMAAYAAKE